MQYELIRTKRRTVGIYITKNGTVVVRAPAGLRLGLIDKFVEEKKDWINTHLRRYEKEHADCQQITLNKEQVAQAKVNAKTYFQKRCAYFAPLLGVTYEKVKVNGAKTRWGSCNAQGDINFTYRLFFLPQELSDYVVVHELAHRKQMNHSKAFWNIVEKAMPDYKWRNKALKQVSCRFEIIEEVEA